MYKVFIKDEVKMGDIIEFSYKYKYYDNPIDAYNKAIANDTLAERVEVLTLEKPKEKPHIICDGTRRTWTKIHNIQSHNCDSQEMGDKCNICGHTKLVGTQEDPRTGGIF